MINETCTQAEFESLHHAVDRCRRGTTHVRVPLQALRHLLIDHGALHAALGKLRRYAEEARRHGFITV
jgi:hypothetical protein